MVESRLTRMLLRLGAGATLAFIYLPLLVIASTRSTRASPSAGRSRTSRRSGSARPGTTRAAAMRSCSRSRRRSARPPSHRARDAALAGDVALPFFGRDTITLLVILPIALPGIVTGLALQTTYHDRSACSVRG